jgi:hypothetical protein
MSIKKEIKKMLQSETGGSYELSDKLCSDLRAGYNSKTAEFEPWQGF